MFGCYRKSEASDPEIYAAATAAVLSEYSREVVDYVTDPRTGLPSRLKWLPSVFEVREACDNHALHLSRLARNNTVPPTSAPIASVSPEETARILYGLQELSTQLKAGMANLS